MQIEYVQILIDRDAMTKVPKIVAPWELPVYEALYDDGEADGAQGFSVDGSYALEVADVPDAQEEFNRLRMIHGSHPKQGTPFVELAYGRGRAGIAELRRAINEAFDIEVEDEAVDDAPKAKRGRKPKASDPLE